MSDSDPDTSTAGRPSNFGSVFLPARRRAGTPQRKRGVLAQGLELVITFAVAIGVVVLLQAFVVKPYKIPSGSMIPTLSINQRILVNRLDNHPHLGSVVVFHPPVGATYGAGECGDRDEGPGHAEPCDRPVPVESSEVYVKRVVGLPGDRLQIRDGIVYRNGSAETLAYSSQKAGSAPEYVSCADGGEACSFSGTITVPAGDYYMMGDNRGDSDDSRFWGPVPQKWIIGVAFFTFWPIDRIGFF